MKDSSRNDILIDASNKKRKQHFVPKFYLKFFADADNKFYAYDLKKRSLLPNRVFYESQCHKKYFYGEDGVLENLLSQKEGEWATVCRKIIARIDLDKSDLSLLKQFVLCGQYAVICNYFYFFNQVDLRAQMPRKEIIMKNNNLSSISWFPMMEKVLQPLPFAAICLISGAWKRTNSLRSLFSTPSVCSEDR